MSLAIGASFFLIPLVLAHLEIQIEGSHGWAEKLPTWRWDSRAVRRWFGKPVTGYHLCAFRRGPRLPGQYAEVVMRASRPGIRPGAIPRSHMGSGA